MTDNTNATEEVVKNEDAYAAKNRDLVARLKKAQEDFQKLQDTIDDEKAAKGDELTKTQRALKKAEDELARVNGLYAEQGKKLSSTIIENDIAQAMSEHNYVPGMAKPLKAMWLGMAEWDAETNTASIGGKPIKEAIAAEMKSKEAASWISAADNSGVNTPGNTNTATSSKFTDYSKVGTPGGPTLTEYAEWKNANPEQAKALEAVALGS